MKIADIVRTLTVEAPSLKFSAYDGSSFGADDAAIKLNLVNERGLRYLATAPGDLGLARAYVSGDLVMDGAHPGNPYEALKMLEHWRFRRPSIREATELIRTLGVQNLVPPQPPAQESLPAWRRTVEGLRHSRDRDAQAIGKHYDVSNEFYEKVLGPSMAYTCAVFPKPDASLEEAQEEKFDLVARKLGLEPGMRLLDVGCGWGGMGRHAAQEYCVRALGVTLSQSQAEYAQKRIADEGLSDLAEVRFLDYRKVDEGDFDAVSAIGLAEHIGRAQMGSYFSSVYEKVRPGGRFLNHCITRFKSTEAALDKGGFIDRYVFPDGELSAAGRLVTHMHDAGFEVRHVENLREHYALTCAAWAANLEAN